MLQASHHFLDQVVAHFLTNLGGFLVGTGQVVAVVYVGAVCGDFIAKQEAILVAVHFIGQGGGQLVFSRAPRARVADGALSLGLVGQHQLVRRAGVDLDA